MLLYALEQQPHEARIIEQCRLRHLPLPNRIQNAPQLRLGLELFYGAFLDLDASRPIGFGPGPISWMTVLDYSAAMGLDEEQTEALLYLVPVLDKVYLTWQSKQKG